MRLVYRPGHPLASENGMVERTLLTAEYEHGEAPHVISDEMSPTRHMADNKHYTSKAKFRAATRAHGCVEVGSEVDYLLKPRKRVELSRQQRVDDIRRAVYELKNGINRR